MQLMSPYDEALLIVRDLFHVTHTTPHMDENERAEFVNRTRNAVWDSIKAQLKLDRPDTDLAAAESIFSMFSNEYVPCPPPSAEARNFVIESAKQVVWQSAKRDAMMRG